MRDLQTRQERVNTLIGGYRLLASLGQGGMAAVHLAAREGKAGFSKRVALKLFNTASGIDPAVTTMFISEARVGGYLSHPNIVEIFDFGEHDGLLYIAMEYVDGPTLMTLQEAHLDNNMLLPLDILLQILIGVCQGLEYAHQANDHEGRPLNLVHRDLKPSNIMVDRHGVPKIVDFGIARAASNLNQTTAVGLLKGTLRYMSPEQAYGVRDLDHRSDIFSLGIILYEMLVSWHFYDGDCVEVVFRLAQDADVEPRLALLPEGPYREPLLAILHRALDRDRQTRYQSAGELASDLEALLLLLPERRSVRTWLQSAETGLGVQWTAPITAEPLSSPTVKDFNTSDRKVETGQAERRLSLRKVAGGLLIIAGIGLGYGLAHTLNPASPVGPVPPTSSHEARPSPTPQPMGQPEPLALQQTPAPSASRPQLPTETRDKSSPLSQPVLPPEGRRPTKPMVAPPESTTQLEVHSEGVLSLNSSPQDVRVLVDGRLMGQTPLPSVAVKAGGHTLLFQKENGAVLELQVDVAESKTLRCMADFAEGAIRCR